MSTQRSKERHKKNKVPTTIRPLSHWQTRIPYWGHLAYFICKEVEKKHFIIIKMCVPMHMYILSIVYSFIRKISWIFLFLPLLILGRVKYTFLSESFSEETVVRNLRVKEYSSGEISELLIIEWVFSKYRLDNISLDFVCSMVYIIYFNAFLCTLYSVTCNLYPFGKVGLGFKYIISITWKHLFYKHPINFVSMACLWSNWKTSEEVRKGGIRMLQLSKTLAGVNWKWRNFHSPCQFDVSLNFCKRIFF